MGEGQALEPDVVRGAGVGTAPMMLTRVSTIGERPWRWPCPRRSVVRSRGCSWFRSRYHSPGTSRNSSAFRSSSLLHGCKNGKRSLRQDAASGLWNFRKAVAPSWNTTPDVGCIAPVDHQVHFHLGQVVPVRNLRARDLYVGDSLVGSSDSIEVGRSSRAQIRGTCPDRLGSIDVELAEPRRDASGLPYALRRIRKSPSTDWWPPVKRGVRSGVEVFDVEALGSGIGGSKGKRAGQGIRAAAKVDDDVAGHGAVHCAHDIASLGERAKGQRQSARIAVVALGRDVVGRLCVRRRVSRSAVGGQGAMRHGEQRSKQPLRDVRRPRIVPNSGNS